MKFDLERFKTFPNEYRATQNTLNITRHFEYEHEAIFEVISTTISSVESPEHFLGLVISNEYASGGIWEAVRRFQQYDIYSQLRLESVKAKDLKEVFTMFEPISHCLPSKDILSSLVLLSDWNDKWIIFATRDSYYSLHWSTSA